MDAGYTFQFVEGFPFLFLFIIHDPAHGDVGFLQLQLQADKAFGLRQRSS
jgi:hypothetical protein